MIGCRRSSTWGTEDPGSRDGPYVRTPAGENGFQGMDPGQAEHKLDRRTRMSQRDMHDRPDLYVVLEVDPSATFVEIRAAFRQRALVLHADSFDRTRVPEARAQANEMLRELNEAYRTLRNPHLRREYDLGRAGRHSFVPNPTPSRPPEPRRTVRQPRPPKHWGRNLGRIAVVLGFGLLVLWAVLVDMAERRNAEAFFLLQPSSGATSGPLR